MRTLVNDIVGNMRPEELAAHRADLTQKAVLLGTMPSPKEIEENWPWFLAWQNNDDTPPSFHAVLDDGDQVPAHLSEFFQFWCHVQLNYLAVLTFHGEMTMEGVVYGR